MEALNGKMSTTPTTTTMPSATTELFKKGVKAQFGRKPPNFTKLREDLRQRCKQRMKEQREELFMQRRFGVSNDNEVDDKLKEILEEELKDLVHTDSACEARSEIEKHIDSSQIIDELRTELVDYCQ
ncbi:uncharacterized protein LOC106636632 isoform X2 [Copidosoma floridanum]|uniref:uncharacterized protein LOC106636632 isoform X2 n=1 Tax=Copidosoma floridanum TaxID=29053 RepID=UPI000C6F805A|nr:uncharacterized protein LOC106636632 isoform X2 [Copidosoma floridanum]